jgi:muconate cycloisomerase
MGIHIGAIRTRIVEHALRPARTIVSAAGRHDSSRFLMVSVLDCDGTTGYGEAATTPLWSGETADAAQAIVEGLFAPQLVGNHFDHPREALAVLDRLSVGNSFAKSALDTALWDLWARRRNVAATALFSDRPPAAWVPTRASVGCHDIADTVRIATEFYEADIRTLKFKVGVPGLDDAGRLRAVRESLGEEIAFTVDANGAYKSAAEAIAAIEELLPYRLQLVEQPTPRDRISLLGQVRSRVEVPIMADESVFTIDHLQEAIDTGACDVVSLYPGKNGGVTRVIEMAEMAARAGVKCAIGSNLETDLGQAAMAALAASLSAFPIEEVPCDLPAALFYCGSSVTEPLLLREGRVRVPSGPGFGVEPVVVAA